MRKQCKIVVDEIEYTDRNIPDINQAVATMTIVGNTGEYRSSLR
jgi:hypothetical protein